MRARVAPWAIPAPTQNPFRRAKARIRPATTSWGRSAPARRTGTRNPTSQEGAPTAPSIQGRTSPGEASCSASLVEAPFRTLRRKFPGTSRQASSGMASQARSSSSPATAS
jgi:hypothetical protein